MRSTALILTLTSYLAVTLPVPRAEAEGPPPLKVVGRELKTPDGKAVRLRGVNIPSMAWGHGENLWKSLDVALDWGANLIRFPLSQDHWFGRPTRGKWNAQLYRDRVRMFVDKAAAKKCYVLLDLHSSDAGTWGKNIGYHNMPDENSIPFWDDLARTYANHPAVLFELFNEPRYVSWDVWRNGGEVVEGKGEKKLTYKTLGLQKLLDVCRATGAKNIIVAGGLGYSYDLTGVAKGFALDDPQSNLMYTTHIYSTIKWWGQGKSRTQRWEHYVMSAGAKYPVLIGEFGNGPDNYDKKVIDFAEKTYAGKVDWSSCSSRAWR
jgi:hypothetical protein